MSAWRIVGITVGTLILAYAGLTTNGTAAAQQSAARSGALAGMARVSGTVEAAAPFRAAQVYLRNTDKLITYTVFTNAGQFRAVALFPGNYEVNVTARGLRSEVQKVVLRPGDNPRLQLSLRDAAAQTNAAASAGPAGPISLEPYDKVYPPGPGKAVAEQVCMVCHGENFLPSRPASEAVWNTRIDHMVGRMLHERDGATYAEGLLGPRVSMFPFSRQDRADLLAYMVKHFGPGSPRRAVKAEREPALDEAVLGKAMYIEYHIPPDPPGQGSKAPEYVDIGYRGRRVGQDVRFDRDGNVWLVDRGFPHRLVKLDPRTGQQKDFLLPDPKNGHHEVLIDREGMIWLPEHSGVQTSTPKRLLGFNPKTERFEHLIPMDPDNEVRNSIKWLQSLALDSKGNIYVGWIMGGAISKWERATNKVSVFRIPTPHAIPYGVVADRNDNIWIALWSGGKIAKFDTTTHQWTEFTPPTYPRQPYDVAEDAEGNIWFADSPAPDRVAAIGRFNPRDQTFTFYPKPQGDADTPKIQITRDGAVWYSPRGSVNAPAISVMFPDMDRIATLGAYYLNDPPGYPFRVTRPAQTARAAR